MISTLFLKRAIFFLVTIDILILPYFPFFAINSFFFLVFISFCISKPDIQKNSFYLALGFIYLASLSTFLSNILNPQFLAEDVKRLIQLVIFFIFYFYYYDYFKRNNAYKSVVIINDIFFISVGIWALIYINNFELFLNLKSLFNRNDSFVNFLDDGTISVYRFSYIWTDPNNIAYAILGTFIFSIINLKVVGVRKLAYLLITLLVLVGAMSTAGWLIFAFFVIPILIFRSNLNISKSSLILLPIIVLMAIFYSHQLVSYVQDSNIVNEAINRYEMNNLQTESGLSRVDIWKNVISNYEDSLYKYFFIGEGYQLSNQGRPIKPHNGILLILFAYGLPALIIFLHFFFSFKLNKKYLFVVPFFICFFINIMIGETKLTLLYIYLYTFVKAESINR